MSHTLYFVLLFIVSFALGSIPWGVVISRLFFGKDLRKEGSGNIGTTNAIRSMGKIGGFSVFVLDFGKGLAAGLIASAMPLLQLVGIAPAEQNIQLLCTISFLGCVWGHVFSPWLHFKGGKGIAVAIGNLFVTFGLIGACLELVIFIVLVLLTRYVSVGSLAAAIACPFFALYFLWGNWLSWFFVAIAAITVVWAHRENIKRLIAGTENRIGDKSH